ncbi:transcriptional repressor [Marinilabiliaceae bacterium JC040]|nr:transcriptional repressor [Marinilabiliaceae bacterium JC040]
MVDVNNIDVYLKSQGIRPSFHRMKILEYLLRERNHPTVDTIFDSLRGMFPTLSRTTVYNTMKLFLSHGVVQALTIEEKEVRYDADTSLHGHFKCVVCGAVYDFGLEEEIKTFMNLKDFQINEHYIFLKGVCKTCLESREV